ncbi:hypothetical protein [Saccharopolyspora sp. ASAGF58]|uniref:hypothetical protein n=1 Tax=Saccharopolyspora sp. ASAGF58 TaxID=2719023 RepID=UPI001B30EF00
MAATKTKAICDSDDYVIDGPKMWLTNGGASNLIALVKTDERAGKAQQNLTTFLVETPERYGEVLPGRPPGSRASLFRRSPDPVSNSLKIGFTRVRM